MEFPGHGARLLARLRRQRELGFLCDCTVQVGEARFPAHRAVLAACSVYFHLCYRDQPAGGRDTVRLDRDIVTAAAFGRLLDFMYEGRLDLRRLPVEDVLAAASYLHMQDVVAVCKDRLRELDPQPPRPLPAAPRVQATLPPPAPLPCRWQAPGPPDGALDLSLKSDARQGPSRPPGAQSLVKDELVSLREQQDGGCPGTPGSPRRPSAAPAAQGAPAASGAHRQEQNIRSPGSQEGHLCMCPLCCQLLPSARVLQLHLSAHFRERDGVRARLPARGAAPTCPQCSKTFSCAYTLKRHERTHSGEKPYTCVQCGKSFQYSHNLSRHAVVHTREKPHSCRWCQRRFTQSGDLYRHVRKFHSGLLKSLLG
ncbi:zinc finger and BTB domain-containing protein 42 [Ochotona princeps]|uniref:zinc finger and BTB domain-containing protein 42 n=1 Tax=Ochotona princeps TaxID=9978 RepID=UPI0027148E79|nr:zinc finger and BTB domain-containing protein 42 [Ochotona princeps]